MACTHNINGVGGTCGLNIQVSPTVGGLVSNPDATFIRSPFLGGSATINGTAVKVWGFNDGYSGLQTGPFPSPAIRVRQGQIVHTKIYSPSMPHTIHHHGIEPQQIFDGVGHTSYDILGFYTYQWRPHQAGTYIYHCHTNTVLHAEMGMYGALIVDPPKGQGWAADNTTQYNVERVWAVDDIDSSWHCLDWDAAVCSGDAGLNNFNPDLFCITGKGQAELNTDANLASPAVAIKCSRGQTVMLRYIVASYVPQRITFDSRLGDVIVIAEDGRVLPQQNNLGTGAVIVGTSAERFDIILRPNTAGTKIPVTIEFLNYRCVSGTPSVIGSIKGYVNVS